MSASRWGLFCSVLLGLQVLVVPGSAVAAPVLPGSSSKPCTASWTNQPVTQLGINEDYLASITGTSPTSLYAVGQHDEIGGYSGRIVRNAGSGWTDVALPDSAAGIYTLTSSVSTTANAAWVGGYSDVGDDEEGVLLQVVGSTATEVAIPTAPTGDPHFESMALASSGGSDLWVGASYYSGTDGGVSRLYHRTSTGAWTTIVVPFMAVNGLAAVSPTVAYLGGGSLSRISGGTVSTVVLPGDPVDIYNVVANNADDVWTLGENDIGNQLIDHFDGSHWTSIPVPDPAVAGRLATFAVAPNGTVWVTGSAPSVVTGLSEPTIARYDPVTATWAITHAAAAVGPGNLPVGEPVGLLALGNGNVYMVGGGSVSTPVAAKLCQLPASLSAGASAVTAATLGDGVLVTSPQGASGTTTVSDTTGLLSTGPLHAGQGAALPGSAAATYTLHTTAGSATATFAVPPTSSTFNFKTTVTIATRAAPAGYVYQVQLMRPGSTTWESTTLSAKSNGVAKYLYSVLYPAGNYLLRARVERLATATKPAVSTGWSPTVTAVVEG